MVLSKEQFLTLYAQQSRFGSKGITSMRQLLAQNVSDLRAMTLTMDGRLAIGSIVVQGIGLVNGLGSLADAKTRKDVRDAWFGVYDSTAGVLGGLLELWAVIMNTRTIAQAGVQGASKSISLASIRFAGNIAGAAGGVIGAASAFAKMEDADRTGNRNAVRAYLLSGVALTGIALTSTAASVGIAAEWIVARQVGGAVTQRSATAVALRIGAQGTPTVLGISVTGWGLLLLGAGFLFQFVAIVLTPTPLQKWVSRSYFGKGDDKYPKGDWKTEKDGLIDTMQSGTEEASNSKAREPVAQ
ncbi:hypothetical protein [Pseudorhodoferax sp.]|uniref:hypothetical protein n=1 Tax=Pseudorhodoferax sp. TaxID=1993553 RepID=UPI0039E2B2CC